MQRQRKRTLVDIINNFSLKTSIVRDNISVHSYQLIAFVDVIIYIIIIFIKLFSICFLLILCFFVSLVFFNFFGGEVGNGAKHKILV